MDGKALWAKLESVKYPLLILLVGLALLLWPSGSQGGEEPASAEKAIEQLLAETDGIGRVQVLVSDKGAVVICDGADKPGVRLDILHALRSYTGFGADTVTVLKMKEPSRR